MIFIGVQVFRKGIYIAFVSEDTAFSDKQMEIKNNPESIEDFINIEILPIKDQIKLCVINLVANYKSSIVELLAKQIPILEVDTAFVIGLDSYNSSISDQSLALAKYAAFESDRHVDKATTMRRLSESDKRYSRESDSSFKTTQSQRTDNIVNPERLTVPDDRFRRFMIPRKQRRRDLGFSSVVGEQNKTKDLKSIPEYHSDDFRAEIRRAISSAIHGYSEDGSHQRSENLYQRVLIDLVNWQKKTRLIFQQNRKQLSEPGPSDLPDSKILVGNNFTLSPELVFEVFEEIVGDGIGGLLLGSSDAQEYQESTKFKAGTNDPGPLLEVFKEVKFSILPRILRGSNKYDNWLQNLLQLLNLMAENDQELTLESRSRQGSFVDDLISLVSFSSDMEQEKLTGKNLVLRYVEQQEDLNRKRADSNFKAKQYLDAEPIYNLIERILKPIEEDQQKLPWSYSEIKAKLYATLCEEVLRGGDISIKDVYRACRKYFDNKKSSKIKDQIGLLIEELEIACSLTDIDGYYVIETLADGAKINKLWQSGPWLQDLKTKHVLQWGLEYNHLLAIDRQKNKRQEEGYIKINFSLLDRVSNPNLEQDLLPHSHASNIRCLGQDGMMLSVVKWAIENNIRLDGDQGIEEALMASGQYKEETFLLFQMAIERGENDKIKEYVKKAIRRPYIVDCHNVARYLILQHSEYKNIFSPAEIDALYEEILNIPGIKLDRISSRNIDNLFSAFEGSEEVIKKLQLVLREALYAKSKELQKEIIKKKQINCKSLLLKLEKCDQLYDLFASPSLVKEGDTNCCLLGNDSKLSKLFKKYGIKRVAIHFSNGQKPKKGLSHVLNQLDAGAEIWADGAHDNSFVRKYFSEYLASRIAVSRVWWNKKISKDKGKIVKFDYLKPELICSAELRRNIDLAKDVVGGKKINRNSLARIGMVTKLLFAMSPKAKKVLFDEIKEANEEAKKHLEAIEKNNSGSLSNFTDTVRGFGQQIMGVLSQINTKSSDQQLPSSRKSSTDRDDIASSSVSPPPITIFEYHSSSDEELSRVSHLKASPRKPVIQNHILKSVKGTK